MKRATLYRCKHFLAYRRVCFYIKQGESLLEPERPLYLYREEASKAEVPSLYKLYKLICLSRGWPNIGLIARLRGRPFLQ